MFVDKNDFFANPQNKQQFINLVSETLRAAGVRTTHAEGDADCLIVWKALQATHSLLLLWERTPTLRSSSLPLQGGTWHLPHIWVSNETKVDQHQRRAGEARKICLWKHSVCSCLFRMWHCASTIQHRKNTSNQTLGEGGQYILWCSPCLPRPQQQQPGCYCRRRKGICWNVWGQGFISLDLLRLVIYDQILS